MGAEFPLALGIMALIGGAAYGGYAASQAGQKKQEAAGAPAAPASIGNLTDEEAKKAGSSRAFRIGTYFTSPTGVLNTAPRRGTKLVGM